MDNKYLTFLKEDGFWVMIHKLLSDTIALLLIAFAGLATVEGLIPGFISVHLNLAKVLIVIALLIFARIIIGHTKKIALPQSTSKWLLGGLMLWSSLLIVNALIRFPFYAIVIVFILTAIIGKLLYDEFFKK